MSSSEDAFHVVYPEPIRAMLNSHIDALLLAGWEKSAVKALLQAMDSRLRYRAIDFGEPLYIFHSINIRVSIGFVRPLAIQIGVHEESRSVFVRQVVLMNTERTN